MISNHATNSITRLPSKSYQAYNGHDNIARTYLRRTAPGVLTQRIVESWSGTLKSLRFEQADTYQCFISGPLMKQKFQHSQNNYNIGLFMHFPEIEFGWGPGFKESHILS